MPPACPELCHHPLLYLSPGGKEQDAASRALSVTWKAVVPVDPTGLRSGSGTLATVTPAMEAWSLTIGPPGKSPESGSFRALSDRKPLVLSATARTNLGVALCPSLTSQLLQPCHLLPGMALPQSGQGRWHISRLLITSCRVHDCLRCCWPQVPYL